MPCATRLPDCTRQQVETALFKDTFWCSGLRGMGHLMVLKLVTVTVSCDMQVAARWVCPQPYFLACNSTAPNTSRPECLCAWCVTCSCLCEHLSSFLVS